ncbi:MAG TPA: hypothetical protein VFE55_10115 [Acidimicrobiia bacterium]|nr:hypothetical protein [Acidimicrobiia bacterium]
MPASRQWTVMITVSGRAPPTSSTSSSGGQRSLAGLPQKALWSPAPDATRMRASQ